MSFSFPTNFGSAVTPFSPLGKLAVGEENVESKASPLKPVEELAETARTESRVASERTNDLNITTNEQDQRAAQKRDVEARQLEQDQRIIGRLAARDREVRAHEQAHASVGGQLAGSPSYEFQRGPDGVSYAVGGEVSISTSGVPGDPEATIAIAQQIRRAALAPADPSSQDRAVAAGAASLETQAIAQLAQMQRDEVLESQKEDVERELEAKAERDELEQERLAEEDVDRQVDSENGAVLDEVEEERVDLIRRLQEIGVVPGENTEPGELLNLSA